MSWIAASIVFALAMLIRWRLGPGGGNGKRIDRFLGASVPVLCLFAGIGFRNYWPGDWAQGGLGWLDGIFPFDGAATVWAVGTLFIVLYDLWPGHPTNNLTQFAALTLPLVAVFIGGSVGRAADATFVSIGGGVDRAMSSMFGA